MIFDSVATVKRLLEKTRTATGLSVVVEMLEKVYQTGRKYAEGFKKDMKIVFDEYPPQVELPGDPYDLMKPGTY